MIAVYHWWPDCAAWPIDDDDADHRTAYSRDQVTCPTCRKVMGEDD